MTEGVKVACQTLPLYCALGIYKSIQSAGVPQNACVVWRLSGHAHPVRGVVPDRVQPVLGAAGAPRVLGNVRRFLPAQTKMEKQRPQARKNGFRFAMAPLLGRSGACKNARRVCRASPFQLWRPRNGQRTFNFSHFCTALRYRTCI